ncbi:DNA topoisomerase IV subunit A [Burkholderia multivorans]|uniref:DNA topoisomerase 4 subunit A n=2 Tax=Burkholderia multivorans TaxID=87883 RepID=B9BQD5_9BURK|nr:DNA topoisomerase IV subunit A [Burkholderia multivorans]AJY17381.1 DNA topoisomerase IV, A subunit [Burkholderia multivorans ATCC BAA-247]AVR22793.1 DNA topoisomerase IV subunit A [Burkholderia multivorans]EEE06830.1 DNA topoisomerase IV, A subunit [Burkholderia multivorans CGD2]EEE13228.1 DNA topoisomerase IV, A subunit [Burkholderia multivorans CGD2M]EJO53973.1 DNA topoisomerase IV, A subunit [Burkholderia multivorans ATCC BAA-247]
MDDNTSDLFAGSDSPEADALTLGNYAEQAYLSYAVSVVKSRALPDVCDGQKPVQRRILYAMNEMGLGPDAKPVKSARVVGDVLGKYHPHGDQSAYDALVRLAQDFSLRYPLIDGQGNFGSRDGDGAAAMRYTEARLTPISKLLLDEIDQGTVDFMPNYDGSFEEPKTLPSRMPFVLLNGASGIAVGLATEIPSHNLREVAAAAVALIRNPKLTHEELMTLIPGPDFPGGGQIISSDAEIASAYETGRGSLKVRARWKIEDLARGQWQLVVTELPPNTSCQKVLEEIEELTNPKLKLGKKTLTPEQLNTKKAMLDLLDAVRDESGKEAAVRLVFEPKSRTIDQTEFVNSLLAHTSLESNATLNLVMIGADGRPGQKGLLTILDEWVKFRQMTMTRRCRHRLGKVDDRIHILEGRMIVFLNLDEVIRIIRESDEPKAALMSAFGLTDRQAEDILEIRLRQLARLEKIKIEKELESLRDEKAKLEELLANDSAMKRLMIKEIEADAKQYGDDRRTLIQQEKRATFEAKVVDEPVTVVVSQKGWVRALKGHGLDPAGFSFKAGDSLYAAFQCRTPDRLIAWGSSGRVYSVDVSVLPGGRGDGVPVTSLIELESGSHLMHYYAASADQPLLLASSNGFGFIAKVGDMVSRVKAGKSFMTIDPGAVPLAPMPVLPNATQVACLSSGGRLLVFGIDEMKTLSGGGRGVTLMALDDKETLVQALAIDPAGVVLIGTGRGGKVQDETLSYAGLAPHIGKRARKGRAPDTKLKVVTELRPLLG